MNFPTGGLSNSPGLPVLRLSSLILSLSSLAACSVQTPGTCLPSASGTLAESSVVTIYEGLPHPDWEEDLLERELQNKQSISLHGYAFYDHAISPSATDANLLTDLYTAPTSLVPHTEDRLCGSFHPDYLVRWRNNDQVNEALICFGCNEVKSFGESQDSHCDFSRKAGEGFKQTLQTYRKNRPTGDQLSIRSGPDMNVTLCVTGEGSGEGKRFIHLARFNDRSDCWTPFYRLGYFTGWGLAEDLLRESKFPDLIVERCPNDRHRCALRSVAWMGELQDRSFSPDEACGMELGKVDLWASSDAEVCKSLEMSY